MTSLLKRFIGTRSIRVTVPITARIPCTWCGCAAGKYRYGKARGELFGQPYVSVKAFCSKACAKSFQHKRA